MILQYELSSTSKTWEQMGPVLIILEHMENPEKQNQIRNEILARNWPGKLSHAQRKDV